jgi:hypothetical protein
LFNEFRLDNIYSEQLKEPISNLFLGRNASCICFGPSDAGKSYLLRGIDNSDGGLLGRSISEVFNLVEISKQAGAGKNQRSTYFAVKMSVYQVYNDFCNDLLTSGFSKNLKIEKFHSETGVSSKIYDLTEKEIKSKRDFETCLREAVSYRKVLAQFLKVNEIKKKSHFVISLILERRERVNEGYKSMDKGLDRYAQIDFVEMASSEMGLQNTFRESSEDDILFKNISKTFNSICNNIVCASVGQQPKYDSKLSLALKNTINQESQIIFLNCVNPSENPPVRSYKSLKVN